MQVEVLDRAAGDQHDRGDDRDRQQDAEGAADQVDPEVAELAGVPTREAANERDRHGHADRGRDEVLHGQAGHLHQMALGRFTRVGLPVGVRHEADGGVPGQRRRHRRGRVVEVQRQLALDQLEDEQEQDADRREGQHAAGVGAPGLFRFRVGSDQPVDDALTARVLFGAVDPVHVVAQRHVHGRQRDDEQLRGRGSPPSWYSLEPLGEEQCGEEKQREKDRQHQADDVVVAHSPSTNFCTRPSRAKIATVSTMYTTTDMSSPFTDKPAGASGVGRGSLCRALGVEDQTRS